MFSTDNVFINIPLTFAGICDISAMASAGAVRPEHQPLIVGVEPVNPPKDAPAGTPPKAYRYILAFPGSGFMRLPFKVEETAPSITQEQLTERGGFVKAAVEGFSCGSFEVDGGAARPYFKATRISPAPATTAPNKGTAV